MNDLTGANLVSGVAAALVSDSGLAGGPLSDIGLFEVDRRACPRWPQRRRSSPRSSEPVRAGSTATGACLHRQGHSLGLPGPAQGGAVVLNADDPSSRASDDLPGDPSSSCRSAFSDAGRLQHVPDSKDCPVCGTGPGLRDRVHGARRGLRLRHCDSRGRSRAYRASRVRLEGAKGTEFLLSTQKGEADVKIGLPGLYNVYNALAAAAVAGEAGVGLAEISRGLGEFGGAFGRVERVRAGDREAFLLLIENPIVQ